MAQTTKLCLWLWHIDEFSDWNETWQVNQLGFLRQASDTFYFKFTVQKIPNAKNISSREILNCDFTIMCLWNEKKSKFWKIRAVKRRLVVNWSISCYRLIVFDAKFAVDAKYVRCCQTTSIISPRSCCSHLSKVQTFFGSKIRIFDCTRTQTIYNSQKSWVTQTNISNDQNQNNQRSRD